MQKITILDLISNIKKLFGVSYIPVFILSIVESMGSAMFSFSGLSCNSNSPHKSAVKTSPSQTHPVTPPPSPNHDTLIFPVAKHLCLLSKVSGILGIRW